MTATIDVNRLKEILPHRFPVLLVDRVEMLVPGEHLRAWKAITVNEPWYRDLADDADHAYPSVLLIESFGQAAGVLAASVEHGDDVLEGKVILFGSVTDVRFHGAVMPGCVIEHDVRLSRGFSETMMFEGESRVDGEVVFEVARGVMALRPADVLPAQQLSGAAPAPGPAS